MNGFCSLRVKMTKADDLKADGTSTNNQVDLVRATADSPSFSG